MARTGPVDPDVDLRDPAQRGIRTLDLPLLAAVAAGGVLGAESRYALGLAVPTATGGWPTATFLVNLSGCLAIGVLMALITEVVRPHRLLRPFLGVGVLGGYTTFSTAMIDVVRLIRNGSPAPAVLYLLGTALGALVAVWLGASVVRAVARTGRP